MKNKYFIVAASFVFLINPAVLAFNNNCNPLAIRESIESDADKKFFERFKVRKSSSVGDESDSSLPAAVQFVFPSEGSDSYAVDIGVSTVDLYEPNEFVSFSAGVEYHKNTLADSEQDTVLAGFSGTVLCGDYNDGGFAFIQDISVNYKNDSLGSGSGILAKTDFFPLILIQGRKFRTTGIFTIGDFEIGVLPQVGIQFETGNDAFESGTSGRTWRGAANLELRLNPFISVNKDVFDLKIGMSYWKPFGDSDNYREALGKDQSLFVAIASFYFDAQKTFSAGLEFSSGAQPEQGRIEQDILTLKLQLSLGGEK